MPDKFRHRSFEAELMDSPDTPKDLLLQNFRELDILNRMLGGHRTTLAGISKLVTDRKKEYHIADLGCGSGDSLLYIAQWAKSKGYRIKLTGVDTNTHAIDRLKVKCKDYPEIQGIVSDYREFLTSCDNVDIIHSSLFCHHLNDEELKEFFRSMKLYVKQGFVINDLRRSKVAYQSVRILTKLFNSSPLAKNDGPVSVLRSFKRNELQELLRIGQIEKYIIRERWAFRYLVVGWSG